MAWSAAVFPCHCRLGRTADRRDDGRAHGLANIDRGQSRAAGCTVDQQYFTRFKMNLPVVQRDNSGGIGDREAGGGDIIHAIGNRHRIGSLGDCFFRKTAQPGPGHHPVARFESGHTFTRIDDRAGNFQPRRERRIPACTGNAR